MDSWDAPRWANFDASMQSDIDDYFKVEHREHEPRHSNSTDYDSFLDSTNSSTAYGTPKTSGSFSSPMPARNSRGSALNRTAGSLSSAMSAMSLKSAKKIKARLSMTPSALSKPKIATSVKNTLISRVTLETDESTGVSSIVEKIDETSVIIENFVITESADRESGEHNRTLVANENEKHADAAIAVTKTSDVDNENGIVGEEIDLPANRKDDKSIDTNSIENESSVANLPIPTRSRRSYLTEPKTVESLLASMRSEVDENTLISTEERSVDEISAEEKQKIAKLKSCLDPSRRSINDDKRNTENFTISAKTTKEGDAADEITAAERSKIAKLIDCLDPPKRPMIDNRIKENLAISTYSEIDTKICVHNNDVTAAEKKRTAESGPTRATVEKQSSMSRAPKSRVLTSQVRRYSISKFRRRSDKYVSLAEAVSKFQNGTPKRFRSNPKTAKATGPVQKAKQTAKKLTCAMSPILLSKFRARAVSVPNAEEREKLKIEEIRKNRIRPNPIKTSSTDLRVSNKNRSKSESTAPMDLAAQESKKITTNAPKTLAKVASSVGQTAANARKTLTRSASLSEAKAAMNQRKTLTKPGSFSEAKATINQRKILTKPRSTSDLKTAMNQRKTSSKPGSTFDLKTATNSHKTATKPASPTDLKTSMNPPKPPIGLALPTPLPLYKTPTKLAEFVDSFVASEIKKETGPASTSISHKRTPARKMMPSIVSNEEDDIVIKNVEILYYGIPIDADYKNKNITRPVPFSFETRNKESKSKKDKLKEETKHIEEEKTRKSIFHARPAPSFAQKSATATSKAPAALKIKDDNANKAQCPLSFHERNELLMQKKKKTFDDIIEREKKARVFHAKPAPNFKPVFVRGASAENLRAIGDDSNASRDSRGKTRGLPLSARQRGHSQDSFVADQENKAPNVVVADNQQCPKLKNPLVSHNLKIKKNGGK